MHDTAKPRRKISIVRMEGVLVAGPSGGRATGVVCKLEGTCSNACQESAK